MKGGIVAVDDGGDKEGVVRLRPGEVVDAVGGVKGSECCNGGTLGPVGAERLQKYILQ